MSLAYDKIPSDCPPFAKGGLGGLRMNLQLSWVTVFFPLFLFASEIFPQASGDIVINEMMYAPVTGASKEWFEIYNKSTIPFNLNNWKWKDATTTIRTITTQNITLNPNSFAVVCEDSAALKTFYPNTSGIILQSIGWNALNNTGDQVILYSPSGLTIDSVSYLPSWGGSSNNISLERILASGSSNQQTNWGSSMNPSGATPNRINSLTPKNNDLSLNLLTFNRTTPFVGDILGIIANVKNRGLQAANTFSVSFYEDYNRDSIPQASELFVTINSSSPLNPGDSIDFTATDLLDSSGQRQYISHVNYSLDEDTTNNTKVADIIVSGGSTAGSVIINEIMYDYPTGECEWIELFNNSDSVVNLKNWKIQDNTTTQVIITSLDYFLSPDSFVVVSESDAIFANHPNLPQKLVIINGSLPSLNNDGDAVIIFKLNGVFSDMVDYLPSWGGTKVSLEKINPSLPSNTSSSWGSCVYPVGSSPGQQNSIYTKVLPSVGEISVSPNPFSPDGDGFEDYAIISYKLTSYFSQSRVKIYDVKGRLVRTLLNNQAVGSSGSIVFDGMDDSEQKLRLGIYIIFFEALNDQNGVVEQLKTTVVVAARL